MIGPDEIKHFMDKYENDHKLLWEHIVERYKQGICSDYEFLRVEGYYRMHFIFKLLQGDLLEKADGIDTSGDVISVLSSNLALLTDTKPEVAEKTLKDLILKGLIKTKIKDGKTYFFWPHNSLFDELPDEV